LNRDATMSVREHVAELAPKRRFRPYSDYRDSGIEWLGDVPREWATKRLRFVARINPVKSELRGLGPEDDVSFVPMESVCELGGLVLDQTKPLESVYQGYTYFRDGDIVVAKITPCFENGKGSIAANLTNGVAFGTTELHVLRAQAELDVSFLFYLTISHGFRRLGTGEMYGAGGQKRVPDDFLRDFRTPIPPIPEQRAIAVFLDRETTRIDELIAKKQRLIELLAEKRTALITHAVTKGLNPDAQMKDSGIDWLGQVPEHWGVKKLKFLANGGLVNGLFKKKQFFGSGVRLVNVFDIYRDDFVVDETSLERVQADSSETRSYAIEPGDVFFVRSSLKLEGVGKSACMLGVSEPTVFECHLVRTRPNQNAILPHFLINFLNSIPATNRLIALANQVTMTTIDQDKFKGLEIPVPPIPEQTSIVEHLCEQTRLFFALRSNVQAAIQKLREYRSALISAAVTGKIDVRGFKHDEEAPCQ